MSRDSHATRAVKSIGNEVADSVVSVGLNLVTGGFWAIGKTSYHGYKAVKAADRGDNVSAAIHTAKAAKSVIGL